MVGSLFWRGGEAREGRGTGRGVFWRSLLTLLEDWWCSEMYIQDADGIALCRVSRLFGSRSCLYLCQGCLNAGYWEGDCCFGDIEGIFRSLLLD
jgi:hypothetical protein